VASLNFADLEVELGGRLVEERRDAIDLCHPSTPAWTTLQQTTHPPNTIDFEINHLKVNAF
jgi:hypothetical protein